MNKANEIFSKYLKKLGLKYSAQRIKILNTFIKVKRHLTADDLYMLVRKRNPEIGRTTVYRTLKLLCDAEIASEVFFDERIARYEVKIGHEHHDHLVCINCGRFYEVFDSKIEKLQDKLSQSHNFLPMSHRLDIYGLCKKCNK